MAVKRSNKILFGVPEIGNFLDGKDDKTVADLIKKGLPARKINGRWYGHTDTIEKWFESVTNVKNPSDIDI